MRRCQTPRALLLLVLLALLGAGCVGVQGSGKVVDEEVRVGAFQRIHVGSAFRVQVSVGERDGLVLHVDDNVRDRVAYGVTGDTLELRLKPDATVRNATLRADVFVRSLREVQAAGASEVQLDSGPTSEDLTLGVSGGSRVRGRASARTMRADASGASKLDLAGKAASLSLRASGASQLGLEGLQVERLDAELSGASTATVSVSGTISADVSGASTLRYKGTARLERQQTSGSSSIQPA
jgi:Putative auto-transporter adhesin, head GIN domain